MNLNEIDDSGEESDASSVDIVPLDFRTALINDQTERIVMQAKPMHFNTPEEDLKQIQLEESKHTTEEDNFMAAVMREPFKETDGDIILIDPGLEVDKIFAGVDLPCNKVSRINNTSKAPLRAHKQAAPQREKSYESDQEEKRPKDLRHAVTKASQMARREPEETVPKFTPAGAPLQDNFMGTEDKDFDINTVDPVTMRPVPGSLKFGDILDQMGVGDLISSSEGEQAGENKKGVVNFHPAGHHSESDSDAAPVASIADTTEETPQDRRKRELEELKESVKIASSEDESASEMIDTQTKRAEQIKAQRYYKGIKVQSASENEESSDDIDAYWEQQRQALRKKKMAAQQQKKAEEESKKEKKAVTEDDEADELNIAAIQEAAAKAESLQKEEMLRAQAAIQMEIEEKVKAELEEQEAEKERERVRKQILLEQERVRLAEAERKKKQQEELQERLKRQNEERQRRKREEKQHQLKLKEEARLALEAKRKAIRDEQDRLDKIKREEEEELARQRAALDEKERVQQSFEDTVNKMWNGTDLPCLFNRKMGYQPKLSQIPIDLEAYLAQNPDNRDYSSRFKTLIVPLELVGSSGSNDIVNYFLMNSCLSTVGYTNYSAEVFPFKLIGMTMSVCQPPFTRPSTNVTGQESIYNVIIFTFDTLDPDTKEVFDSHVKKVQPSHIFGYESMKQIRKVMPEFHHKLLQSHIKLNKAADFPYKDVKATDDNLSFLNRIAFLANDLDLSDMIPPKSLPSIDLLRRSPHFFAFNPNKQGLISKVRGKIVNHVNYFNYEQAVVIFKEFSFETRKSELGGPPDGSKSSVQFFLRKAQSSELQLDVVGLRMIHLSEHQRDEYNKTFGVALDRSTYLAVLLRGLDAHMKAEQIIGHFNPDLARRTAESSVRAFFGASKDENCTLNMVSIYQKSKLFEELMFWFGGRVDSTTELSSMYVITPKAIEKSYLMISPAILINKLPLVLQRLTQAGISVLDCQRIDYSKFEFPDGRLSLLNKNFCHFKVRGDTFQVQIGFLIKVARENLHQHFPGVTETLARDFDSEGMPITQLMGLTQDHGEYLAFKTVLKKHLRVNYKNANRTGPDGGSLSAEDRKSDSDATLKRLSDYDSDMDPKTFSGLELYSQSQFNLGVGKTLQKSNKKTQLQRESAPVNNDDQFRGRSFVCFLRLQAFKTGRIGEILSLLLHQCGFELLGSRIIHMRRELCFEEVPVPVQHLFKSVAYKFFEQYQSQESKLRKKMFDFKTFALVLRGTDIENKLDQIYDRTKLEFLPDTGIREFKRLCVFLTNPTITEPFLQFTLNTKLIKLYHDLASGHQHLLESPILNCLLESQTQHQGEAIDCNSFVEIKKPEHLEIDITKFTDEESACVFIIKPNQPFSVVVRALKSISAEENGLMLKQMQLVNYTPQQIDLIYKHDFEYDTEVPTRLKLNARETFMQQFKSGPCFQVLVYGKHPLAKVKKLVGSKDPKQAQKNTLRSFYGVDRLDNAFYVSETHAESIIEKYALFDQGPNYSAPKQILSLAKSSSDQTPIGKILSANSPQIALVMISPTMVRSEDFVFVLEDLNRAKFNIANLTKTFLTRADLDLMFSDLTHQFNLNLMWEKEFQKKDGQHQDKSHSILIAVERENAIDQLESLIGRFMIKDGSDFERTKKKSTGMFGFNKSTQNLTSEYGSYIYCFPSVEHNQRKVANFFHSLPNSQHFRIDVK